MVQEIRMLLPYQSTSGTLKQKYLPVTKNMCIILFELIQKYFYKAR